MGRTGNLVLFTWNLFEAVLSNVNQTLVSICMQKLTNDNKPKRLCMIEPGESIKGLFQLILK